MFRSCELKSARYSSNPNEIFQLYNGRTPHRKPKV
jgi:hypothetical protein